MRLISSAIRKRLNDATSYSINQDRYYMNIAKFKQYVEALIL
jgi:hypothetical protein